MSKESYIGGDYIETTGGSSKTYAKGKIINTSLDGDIIQIGKENGVTYGINELPPPFKEDAICIINVRPKETWRGEFAFDWFREGYNTLLDDVDFNEIVGKYYAISEKEIEKKIKDGNTSSLSDYFINDTNAWYIVEKDSDKNIIGAKEFFKKDPQFLSADNSLDKLKQIYKGFRYTSKQNEEKTYYASILGLFPENENYGPSLAELNLHIEYLTDEKPDYLIFKVDGLEITEQHPIIGLSRYIIENPTSLELLSIKCKARGGKNGGIELFYNTTKTIQIYSVKKQDNGYLKENIAGIVKFINPTAAQKKKILIIKVQTSEKTIGKPLENSLSTFEKVLNQCMLRPEFLTTDKDVKEFILDISKEKYQFTQKCNVKFDKNRNSWIMNDKENELGEMLVNELTENFPDYLGTEYFRLYFLDIISESGNTIEKGYSSPISNYGIMFKSHDPETIAHECLHGLGLPHTFSCNTRNYGKYFFSYKAQTTKNIMDYSSMKNNPLEAYNRKPNTYTSKEEYYLWFWQWKKVNKNIQ